MLEDVHKILDSVDNNIELATEKVHSGKKDILLYVISVGLDHIKAKRRANRRRELRREVQPQFRTGKTAGSIELTPKAKERLFNSTKAEDAAKIKGKIWKEGESRRPELK